MRAAQLELRKTVERSFEDQVRQRNRRLERIADDITEEPVALKTRPQFGNALRWRIVRGTFPEPPDSRFNDGFRRVEVRLAYFEVDDAPSAER